MDNWKSVLEGHVWEEGRAIQVAVGSTRHQIVIVCNGDGRQKADFANGEYPYTACFKLTHSNGAWNGEGAGIVPVLSDGRVLLVLEPRQVQVFYEDQPKFFWQGGQKIDMTKFGRYSSLGFPGGAIDKGELVFKGLLRELVEETAVGGMATLFMRRTPVYAILSDLALVNHYGVVYLVNSNYTDHTTTDGGVHIFALTPEDVDRNIRSGILSAGNSVLLPWQFYKEVEEMLNAGDLDLEYASVRTVNL